MTILYSTSGEGVGVRVERRGVRVRLILDSGLSPAAAAAKESILEQFSGPSMKGKIQKNSCHAPDFIENSDYFMNNFV